MNVKQQPIFKAEQFTATKWEDAAQKAKFANQFVAFVLSGFSPTKFPQWFYVRLSMCFMHIAHYNRWGFYNTFFTTYDGMGEFIKQTGDFPCYGDPAYTYSDVERALQEWINTAGIVTRAFQAARQNEDARYKFAGSHE